MEDIGRDKPHVCQIRLSTPLYEATQKYRDNREFSSLVTSLLSKHLEGEEAEVEQLRHEIDELQDKASEIHSELAAKEAQLESKLEEREAEQRREAIEDRVRETFREHEQNLLESGTSPRYSLFVNIADGRGWLKELGPDRVDELIDEATTIEVKA